VLNTSVYKTAQRSGQVFQSPIAFYGASQWRLQDRPKPATASAVSPSGQLYQAQQSSPDTRYGSHQPTAVQSAKQLAEARVNQGHIITQRVEAKPETQFAKLQAEQAYLTQAMKQEQKAAKIGLMWAAVFSKNARRLLRMMAKRTQKQVSSKHAAVARSQANGATTPGKLDRLG
jgi:hypothetical protein